MYVFLQWYLGAGIIFSAFFLGVVVANHEDDKLFIAVFVIWNIFFWPVTTCLIAYECINQKWR